MTSDEVCKKYRCTHKSLQRYIKAGLPFVIDQSKQGKPRVFDEQQVTTWFAANPVKPVGRPDAIESDPKAEWSAAKIREKVAAAKLKEIEIAEHEKRLIPIADIEKSQIALATAVRTRFMDIRNIAARLEGKTVAITEEAIDNQVRSILRELSLL